MKDMYMQAQKLPTDKRTDEPKNRNSIEQLNTQNRTAQETRRSRARNTPIALQSSDQKRTTRDKNTADEDEDRAEQVTEKFP
jgi:hypothetical protein